MKADARDYTLRSNLKSKPLYDSNGVKVCIECGEPVPDRRWIYCQDKCYIAVHQRKWGWKRQQDKKRRDKHVAQMKARMQRLIVEGMCARCGKKKPIPGCVICQDCSEYTYRFK